MTPPFIIFGLPRSRTFWLSRFLTYGVWHCGHDELRHMRSLDDVRAWLSQPCTGTVETGAAHWWRLARQFSPDARVVVVRRPIADAIESWLRLDPRTDRASAAARFHALDRKLQQIAKRWPGALVLDFAGLEDADTCARVFEHCLHLPFDPGWHAKLAPLNLQADLSHVARYARAFAPQTEKLRAIAEHESMAMFGRQPVIAPDGIVIAEGCFDDYYAERDLLMRDHAVKIGESPDYPGVLNFAAMRKLEELGQLQTMIARSNGRMFGYLLTVLHPALVDKRIEEGHHTTFYASSEFPGLGMKLLRAANEALFAKGVDQIVMRAGDRGDGPRLGTLYRRLGAQECGRLYKLKSRGK